MNEEKKINDGGPAFPQPLGSMRVPELVAEIERLRKALENIANENIEHETEAGEAFLCHAQEMARQALEEK